MMAAWMLYTLLTTLLLVVAGGAAERLARAMGIASRFAWAFVVITAIVLSGISLAGRSIANPNVIVITPDRADVSRADVPRAGSEPRASATTIPPHERAAATAGLNALVTRLHAAADLRIDAGRWERYDANLTLICATFAAAGMLLVIASLIGLRRMMRTLAPGEIDGIAVLFSHDLGPAALGFVHRHVVVPHWVEALPVEERRMILLHEQEHAAARDPMLNALGALALALMPWNLPLWIAVARLRFAVEADCDGRVLVRSRCGVRRYGALLLQVHERGFVSRHRGQLPVTAFVESTSHLERRVRRMINRQPKLRSPSTAAACAIALIVAATAFSVRVSSAESLAPTLKTATQTYPPALHVDSVAGPTEPRAPEAAPEVEPRWKNALPRLANSERESHAEAVGIVVPRLQELVLGAAATERTAPRDAFVPETLLVRASNSLWPMKARITVSDSPGEGRVLATDTLGRAVPSADTLIVNGPVRLILPDARFRLEIQSLSGDLAITTSVMTSRDGKGSRWVSTLFGRDLEVTRKAAGEGAEIDAASYVISRRLR